MQSASCEYFFEVESAEQKTVGTEDSHTKDDGPRTPVREPAVLTLPGFTPDRVTTRTTDDPLDIRGDVQAFARLICLEEAAPPLSIGVFGGWGSGKSTFMEQLEAEIDAITANEAKRRRPLEKAPSSTPSDKRIEPRFVANVVQIRFNAWQFADANLWASLSAEFFDQLPAGGYSRIGKDIHAQLVQRVTDHVHKLSQAVDATRAALVQGARKAADAQRARDIAVAENAETGILSQALVDRINEAYEKPPDSRRMRSQDRPFGRLGQSKRQARSSPSSDQRRCASPHRLGDAVEVLVRDNGTGIAPEIRDKLFEPL